MSGDCKGRAYHHRQNRGAFRFHIYDILDFDLFLGYPLEKLLASTGSLDENLSEVASATTTSCLENILAKPLPEQHPLEEMMHTFLFILS